MKTTAPIRDPGAAAGQPRRKPLLHDAQENAQRQRLDRGIVLQMVARRLGLQGEIRD